MKKMIIAAAIASVLAPATVLADTTLYGALRLSAVGGDSDSNVAGGTDSDLGGIVNNASRLGLKGTYGEKGGLQGFFNLQVTLDTDGNGQSGTGGGNSFGSRFAFAGVKGSFGKAIVGRLSTPYKMAGLRVDPFYDTSAGSGNGGANYGLSGLTNGFTNNALGYVSPKLGGAVTINAVAFLNKDETIGAGRTGDDNAYNVGATYSKNGLTGSLQYLAGFNGDDSNDEAVRLAVGYKTSQFSIGASFEDVEVQGQNNGHDNTYVAGTYKVAPKTTLAASFGSVNSDANTTAGSNNLNLEGDGFTVGVFHKIASKTTISALYSEVDFDGTAVGTPNDRDVFAIGLVQKF